MGVGAGLYMCDVVKKFTFAISSPDEFLFLSLTVEALQSKMYQNSLPSGGGRLLGANISGEGVVPGDIFGFYKIRHILLSDSANCTVLRAIVLTQYRRVTDGQTDGIAVASTALAMRAFIYLFIYYYARWQPDIYKTVIYTLHS